jgi:hypothetical protein
LIVEAPEFGEILQEAAERAKSESSACRSRRVSVFVIRAQSAVYRPLSDSPTVQPPSPPALPPTELRARLLADLRLPPPNPTMPSREKNQVGVAFLALLILVGIGSVLFQSGGARSVRQYVAWISFDIHRKLFPEQNAAGPTYDETAKGPVALASIVRQLHRGWPDEGVSVVHHAAREVATGLLHHDDIQVGNLVGGKFVPWRLTPWAAAEKIDTELKAMPDFLIDETRYVFRRKESPVLK